jgi:hypothetical protein
VATLAVISGSVETNCLGRARERLTSLVREHTEVVPHGGTIVILRSDMVHGGA